MKTWLPVIGRLQIEKGNIRIILPYDFCSYYKQFVDKEYKIFSNLPAHGAHVNISRDIHHPNINKNDINRVREIYKNYPIPIYYNNNIIMGGMSRSFRNWYVHVRGEHIDRISDMLGIKPSNFGWHCTLANTKNGVRPYIWMK